MYKILPYRAHSFLNSSISRTDRMKSMVSTLTHIATESGYPVISANIGDVKGIKESQVVKQRRVEVAMRFLESDSNLNGYRPYSGMTRAIEVVTTDLNRRFGEDVIHSSDVVIASGTSGFMIAVKAHQQYLAQEMKVGVMSPTYWKHTDALSVTGISFQEISLVELDSTTSQLSFNWDALDRFFESGGTTLVLNFGNPLSFLPSSDDTHRFLDVLTRHSSRVDQSVSLILDGPYDGLYKNDEGYQLPKALLKCDIPFTYIHPRTKLYLGTGSRWGEVVSNVPEITRSIVSLKGALIGSDSSFEQELLVSMLESEDLSRSLEDLYADLSKRKELFWNTLMEYCPQIARDSKGMYRHDGPFYLYLDVSSSFREGENSEGFCHRLAAKGIVSIPGTLFGPVSPMNHQCIRMAFGAISQKTYMDDIPRLVHVLAELSSVRSV